MKQEALKYFSDTDWTVVAMMIFLTVFIVTVIRVCRKANRTFYEELSQMPLSDERGESHG